MAGLEVADAVWALTSPRPTGGDAARLYAIGASDGVYLVDAGWQSANSYALLTDGLRDAGLEYVDVKGVALTHLHPDHCGLAARIREETGAWIAGHPREVVSAAHRHGAAAPFLDQLRSWLPRAGAPSAESERLVGARRTIGDTAPVPALDIPLEDGATLSLGDRTLTAILTPGHSPGHLCFLDAERRLLFAGDVLLPDRLPPVGAFSFDAASDPVSTFFASLDRVEGLDAELVLPGHGEPFDDVSAESGRIRTHHERRMTLVREFLQAAPATVWDAALAAPWRRPWSELPAFAQLLGLGKVNAHLLTLCNRGLAELRDGAPVTFAAAGAS